MNYVMLCPYTPNAYQGTLDDGRQFYFRARHGEWRLHVGESATLVQLPLVADGKDSNAGWWEPEESESFMLNAITEFLAKGGS